MSVLGIKKAAWYLVGVATVIFFVVLLIEVTLCNSHAVRLLAGSAISQDFCDDTLVSI